MIALLALALAATSQPRTVLMVDPKHRLVEGVTSDGRTIWISSVLDRQILACRKSCRTIATLPAPLYPFALAWDAGRKRLWVAADCPPGVKVIKACERGALVALDRTGRIKARIAPQSGEFHPGDVSASRGDVFVSDSQNGAVYRLATSTYSITPLVAPGIGKSAQGSAVDELGSRLIVADYSQGVSAVDLKTGSRTILKGRDGNPLRGIDGLTRCGEIFLGIYNGSSPGRVLSFSVGSGQFADQLILDDSVPDDTLPDPTQVAFDGKRELMVADSGWATIDTPGFVRKQGATIVIIPVPAGFCERE